MKKLILLFALAIMAVNAYSQNVKEAEYPDGETALQSFISSNLQPTKSVLENHVYGTIYVRVNVSKKGKPTKVEVTKPSGYSDMDMEAERVVKLIKKWNPETVDGKPVDGEIVVAVEFTKPQGATVNASYPGGEDALQEFFRQNMQYPSDALEDYIEGKVYVQLTVDAQGKSKDIIMSTPTDYPGLDAEAMRLVSLVSQWTPMTINGQPTESKLIVPVVFKLPESNTSQAEQNQHTDMGTGQATADKPTTDTDPGSANGQTSSTTSQHNSRGNNTNRPVNSQRQVAKMAAYPGGMVAMTTFISQNRKYPEDELRKKVEGDVTVKFTVDESGSIINPTIQKSVTPNLDAEAIRIVKLMPKWQPAVDTEGNNMPMEMTVTVNFRTPRAIDGVPFH
jgi:TonB family protein